MAAAPSVGPYTGTHVSPQGPGDARPTAFQILKDNGAIGEFTDKTFLVTGGTSGIGLETVRQLAKTGARVFFTARNEAKGKKVVQDLAEEAKTDADLKGARVEWVIIDNASMKSVKHGAEDFLKRSNQLNVLLCNAGIANIPHSITEDGFEEQFATNHLAHFYLFQFLKPLLLKSSTPSFNSRVVNVSSSAHAMSTVQFGNYNQDKKVTSGYLKLLEMEGDANPMISYGQSKTANIWFANEIDRRYGAKGLHGLSLNPGNIFTTIWAKVDPKVAKMLEPWTKDEGFQKSFKSPEQGAATQVLAAIGKEFEGKGGIYLDDCGVSQPLPTEIPGATGYGSWAYDPEGEKRLWAESLKFVGMKDDQ